MDGIKSESKLLIEAFIAQIICKALISSTKDSSIRRGPSQSFYGKPWHV